MTEHPKDITGTEFGAGVELEQALLKLEQLADQKEALQGKIERLRWCLNLHLLDGFDRDELEQLNREVCEFRASCLACRSEAFK